MLKPIEEHGKYVEITGFKGIKVNDAEAWLKEMRLGTHQDLAVQFFDADLVATWEHLYFAALNTLTSFKNGRNVSKNVVMEQMLYASAQRQINKAIAFMGVKRGFVNVAVTIISEYPAMAEAGLSEISKRAERGPDERVLEMSADKARRIRVAFGISDEEIEAVIENNEFERALVDLVIERMALLPTRL
jgi:tRNA threonylcarbamoyladenosine modification (KEOPS) complex Cgi121 subunit